MAQSTKPDPTSSRPWIFSATYWNDVAKDVVKAACAALVIYLCGVIGGVFKLHIEVLVIVLIIVVTILLYAALEYLVKIHKLRPALAGYIVGIPAAGGITEFISLKWHLPSGWYYLIGAGFATLVLVIGRWLGRRVLPKAVGDSSPDISPSIRHLCVKTRA